MGNKRREKPELFISTETDMDILEDVQTRYFDCLHLQALRLGGRVRSSQFRQEAMAAQSQCITQAVGHYAEWVARIALARKKYLIDDIHAHLMHEAISFGQFLTDWEIFRDSHNDHFLPIKTVVQEKRLKSDLKKHVREWESDWAIQADTKIRLQRLIYPDSRQLKGELLTNATKQMIQFAKLEHPNFTQLELCGLMDEINLQSRGRYSPPKEWKSTDDRKPWTQAFGNPKLKNRVKRYLSGVPTKSTIELKPLVERYRSYVYLSRNYRK